MKYQTTRKSVVNGYYKIISCNYCEAQFLLNYHNPVAYTCGIYGWNADVYDFGNIAIVTGYRPFGNVNKNYDLLNMYNQKAKQIIYNPDMTYSDKVREVNNLLVEYMGKVC